MRLGIILSFGFIVSLSVLAELTSEQQQEFLQLHNDQRTNVNPPATDMTEMIWDQNLASAAQSYADNLAATCSGLAHDPNNEDGENLASDQASVSAAFTAWAGESVDYDYETNSCATGKVCGHYTQIVWATSNLLGCGKADCASGPQWVCRYSPAGNVVGEKPYTAGQGNTQLLPGSPGQPSSTPTASSPTPAAAGSASPAPNQTPSAPTPAAAGSASPAPSPTPGPTIDSSNRKEFASKNSIFSPAGNTAIASLEVEPVVQ